MNPLEQEFPAFFSTIEDFLWFKLRLVRVDERSAAPSVGAGGPLRALRVL